jgi:hypothetical protein
MWEKSNRFVSVLLHNVVLVGWLAAIAPASAPRCLMPTFKLAQGTTEAQVVHRVLSLFSITFAPIIFVSLL